MSSIRVENLRKQFRGLGVVDDTSFTAEKGESFAFLGPNEAGKSTAIKMMVLLLAGIGSIAFRNM